MFCLNHVASHELPVGIAGRVSREDYLFAVDSALVDFAVEAVFFPEAFQHRNNEHADISVHGRRFQRGNMIACDKFIAVIKRSSYAPAVGDCDAVPEDSHAFSVADKIIDSVVHGGR